ncbi:MAG: pilus assembly protein PilP [Actinomycetota bacterium]|nr:pilus assembly protein PilP [Actinomycetota bacterium]
MKKNWLIALLPLMALAIAATAGGATSPAPGKPGKPVAVTGKAVLNAAAPAPGVANSAPVKPEEETFEYNADGRRDPFLSLIYVQKQAQANKKRKIAIPLEEYDLSDFQLEAVVISGNRYAMVKLPNGKYYDLRIGTVAGVNGGRVVRISRNSVTIVESIPDFKGVKHNNAVTLRLRKEEE